MGKHMARILALVLALCCLAVPLAGMGEGQVGTVEMEQTETAQEAISRMKIGWNLGNTFDATGAWIARYTARTNQDFETAWGNPVTPDTLMHRLKELGFNAIRLPVTWHYHFDEEGQIDEVWLNRIQEVADQVLAEGMYCIVNMHHDTGSDGWLRASEANYEKNAELFASLWRQIALRFRDYPDTLMLEGFNEMLDENSEWNNPDETADGVINAWNQLFVDTVRATGGRNETRNLLVCTYAAANTEAALKGFRMPQDSIADHLIAEVHFYSPYEFITSEELSWTDPVVHYSSYVEEAVDGTFERIQKYLGNIPMVIGEFAADDKNNTADRIQWYTRVIQNAKGMGTICMIWDNGKGFTMGLADREGTDDPFPEIIEACMKAVEE